jgi:hypothetical protein
VKLWEVKPKLQWDCSNHWAPTSHHVSQMVDMELQDLISALMGFGFALVPSLLFTFFYSYLLEWKDLLCAIVYWKYVICFCVCGTGV